MIFKSLSVVSMRDKTVKNYYEFNPVGLNLILGEKNDESDETNGVGKTALIESIEYCLGANLPKSLKGKEGLIKEDIFIVLDIECKGKSKSIGRLLSDDSFGYISEFHNICYELKLWDAINKEDFKKYIEHLIYSEFHDTNIVTLPSFSSTREYIMRNEKSGFSGIEIKQRKASAVNQIISFLSLLPCYYENNISQQKNIIKAINSQLNDIKEIGKEINEIRLQHKKTLEEIENLKKILNDANISEKLNNDEEEYYFLKSQLNDIHIKIRKFEFAQAQYKENINDLENNLQKINEFVNLKAFYDKTIGYFPDVILKNFKEMQEFYEFMLNNRGEYIRKQLSLLEKQLKPLYEKRNSLLNRLSINTHFAKNSNLVRDLQDISGQLADKYKSIAEYNYKIELYSKKEDIENERKKQIEILESLIQKYKEDYDQYQGQIDNIINHFNILNQNTYGAQGSLIYRFEDSLKTNIATGRIKISCNIEDEDAHGRFLMKINMFDIALLLNRVDENQGLTFLFHDGSYSKPTPSVKEKLLLYVDNYLKQKSMGQYFVTLNVEELTSDTMSKFKENNNIVARLQRTESNEDRFMGIKY